MRDRPCSITTTDSQGAQAAQTKYTYNAAGHPVQQANSEASQPVQRIIEISEYAALRDLEQHYVSKLVDLLTAGLKRS